MHGLCREDRAPRQSVKISSFFFAARLTMDALSHISRIAYIFAIYSPRVRGNSPSLCFSRGERDRPRSIRFGLIRSLPRSRILPIHRRRNPLVQLEKQTGCGSRCSKPRGCRKSRKMAVEIARYLAFSEAFLFKRKAVDVGFPDVRRPLEEAVGGTR